MNLVEELERLESQGSGALDALLPPAQRNRALSPAQEATRQDVLA